LAEDLHLEASKGEQAQTLLDNELLKGAFEGLESEYTKAWRDTAVRDTDARERLWQALQIVGKVQTHLKAIVMNGQLARHEINQVAQQKQSLLDRLKS
jgi:hypothetical protein